MPDSCDNDSPASPPREGIVRGCLSAVLGQIGSSILVVAILAVTLLAANALDQADRRVDGLLGLCTLGIMGAAGVAAGGSIIVKTIREKSNRTAPAKLLLAFLLSLFIGGFLIAMGGACLYILFLFLKTR